MGMKSLDKMLRGPKCYNFSNLHLAMHAAQGTKDMCQLKSEYPDMHRVERTPCREILCRQDLLYSLRGGSKLSSLRRLVTSLGARDGAREGALEGALDGAREGALDGALDGALPFDTRDLALDAVSSSSSSGGAASNLGARVGASEGSLCLSGRYVNVRMSLTVSASSWSSHSRCRCRLSSSFCSSLRRSRFRRSNSRARWALISFSFSTVFFVVQSWKAPATTVIMPTRKEALPKLSSLESFSFSSFLAGLRVRVPRDDGGYERRRV